MANRMEQRGSFGDATRRGRRSRRGGHQSGHQPWGTQQPHSRAQAGTPTEDDRWQWHPEGADTQAHATKLVLTGATASAGKTKDRALAQQIAQQLAAIDHGREPWLATRVAAETLLSAMNSLYEHGWQPMDTLHVVRRAHSWQAARLAVATITYQAAVSSAEHRAPLSWVQQLEEVREHDTATATAAERAAHRNPGARPFLISLDGDAPQATNWCAVLELIGQWHDLPVWPQVSQRPSQWPSTRREPVQFSSTAAASTADAKVLHRIRGLLAKAESTDYSHEADLFTAKAQELMTRYSIDSALLEADGDGTRSDVLNKRIHINNPYTKAKVHMLHEIGQVNGVRVVWDEEYAVATAVGAPVNLRQVELLFTSILVQATHAMSEVGRGPDPTARSASFRRAFLFAYAVRIGQRLHEVQEQTMRHAAAQARKDGRRLLPILAAQHAAVNQEFERLFPRTEKQAATPLDARGWIAGKVAADQAVLTAGGEEALEPAYV